MQREIVEFGDRNFGRINLEHFAGSAAGVYGIQDEQPLWAGWTQAKREQQFAHAGADIQQADAFGDPIMVLDILDDGAAETVIAE